jgi:hypothetical protein
VSRNCSISPSRSSLRQDATLRANTPKYRTRPSMSPSSKIGPKMLSFNAASRNILSQPSTSIRAALGRKREFPRTCPATPLVSNISVVRPTLLFVHRCHLTVTFTPPSPTSPDCAACPHQCRAPAPCDTPAIAAPRRAGSVTATRSVPASGSRAGHRPR